MSILTSQCALRRDSTFRGLWVVTGGDSPNCDENRFQLVLAVSSKPGLLKLMGPLPGLQSSTESLLDAQASAAREVLDDLTEADRENASRSRPKRANDAYKNAMHVLLQASSAIQTTRDSVASMSVLFLHSHRQCATHWLVAVGCFPGYHAVRIQRGRSKTLPATQTSWRAASSVAFSSLPQPHKQHVPRTPPTMPGPKGAVMCLSENTWRSCGSKCWPSAY